MSSQQESKEVKEQLGAKTRWDSALGNSTLYEFRKKWRSYSPYTLASVKDQDDSMGLWEFVSWPWLDEKTQRAHILARPINSPTEAQELQCRKEVVPVRWSRLRQKAYIEGFKAGTERALFNVRLVRHRANNHD